MTPLTIIVCIIAGSNAALAVLLFVYTFERARNAPTAKPRPVKVKGGPLLVPLIASPRTRRARRDWTVFHRDGRFFLIDR